MKRFLIKTLILFLVLLPPAAFLEGISRKIYTDDEKEFNQVIRGCESASAVYETVILGSSHSKRGIVPTLLSTRIGNLAFYSQDLYYNVELLKYFLPNSPNLKQVVVEIDHFTMCYDQTDVSRFTARRYRKLGIQPRNRFNIMLFLQANSEFINHRETFFFDAINFIFKGQRPASPIKRPPKHESGERAVKETLQERVKLHNGFFRGGKIFRRNVKVLDELNGLSKQYGFNVIILHSPVTDLYIEGLSPELKGIFARTVDLIKNRFPEWRILDLSRKYENEYDQFRDADHLSPDAARLYTIILRKELGELK